MKRCYDCSERDVLRERADQMLGYANEAKQYAQKWGDYTTSRAKNFSLFDFAILQTCMISLGLWMGATFSGLFKKIRGVLFVAFAASWAYMFWRVFVSDEE